MTRMTNSNNVNTVRDWEEGCVYKHEYIYVERNPQVQQDKTNTPTQTFNHSKSKFE